MKIEIKGLCIRDIPATELAKMIKNLASSIELSGDVGTVALKSLVCSCSKCKLKKCRSCGEDLTYTGKFWKHIGNTPRHIGIPVTDHE